MFDGSRWQDIRREFPLDYQRFYGTVPKGRKVRSITDEAAQYGDLLEHGNCYVHGMLFRMGASSSGGTYRVSATVSSGTTTITFPMATASSS